MKWWMYLVLTALWVVTAVLNAHSGRGLLLVGYDLLVAGMMAALAFIEKSSDRKRWKWLVICLAAPVIIISVVLLIVR